MCLCLSVVAARGRSAERCLPESLLPASLSIPSAPASSLPSARTDSVSPSGKPQRLPPEPGLVPVSFELSPPVPLVLSVLVNVYFLHEDVFCTFELGSTVPVARLHMWSLAALGELHPAAVRCDLFYLQPEPIDLRDTPADLHWPEIIELTARTFAVSDLGVRLPTAEQPLRGPGGFLPVLPGPRIPLLEFAPDFAYASAAWPASDSDEPSFLVAMT